MGEKYSSRGSKKIKKYEKWKKYGSVEEKIKYIGDKEEENKSINKGNY